MSDPSTAPTNKNSSSLGLLMGLARMSTISFGFFGFATKICTRQWQVTGHRSISRQPVDIIKSLVEILTTGHAIDVVMVARLAPAPPTRRQG